MPGIKKRTMLSTVHYDAVEPFCIHSCVAKIIDIYDADTITVALELEGNIVRMPVRITGIDAPEFDPSDPTLCVY